ncbi:hypothetical protein QNM97_13885 [Gordonia sp. L191]|uniref:hypothetical protein n=1 Tax=Gordonia sp. L191 TaxID=2982699 RepID=UPI0024C078E0|nr:hypothetical protein [Gordonia sp. L191]WHU45142.1 hypothetical protein QNM97_13885 [Gordonia sp. L191]
MTTYRLDLPYSRPPLNLNDRGHHMAKARKVKQVRNTVHLLAIAAHLPRDCEHITVQLHYAPRDERRRDPINLTLTQKACVDGLAAGTTAHPGYGLVADDTPMYVTDLMPRIHPKTGTGVGKLWLEIEVEIGVDG